MLAESSMAFPCRGGGGGHARSARAGLHWVRRSLYSCASQWVLRQGSRWMRHTPHVVGGCCVRLGHHGCVSVLRLRGVSLACEGLSRVMRSVRPTHPPPDLKNQGLSPFWVSPNLCGARPVLRRPCPELKVQVAPPPRKAPVRSVRAEASTPERLR